MCRLTLLMDCMLRNTFAISRVMRNPIAIVIVYLIVEFDVFLFVCNSRVVSDPSTTCTCPETVPLRKRLQHCVPRGHFFLRIDFDGYSIPSSTLT